MAYQVLNQGIVNYYQYLGLPGTLPGVEKEAIGWLLSSCTPSEITHLIAIMASDGAHAACARYVLDRANGDAFQSTERAIRHIETQLAKAERTPEERAADMAAIEATVSERISERIQRLDQAMLDDRDGLQDVFMSLFPDGLIFTPAKRQNRQVWAISGSAHLGGFNLRGDPNGICCELKAQIPFKFNML